MPATEECGESGGDGAFLPCIFDSFKLTNEKVEVFCPLALRPSRLSGIIVASRTKPKEGQRGKFGVI